MRLPTRSLFLGVVVLVGFPPPAGAAAPLLGATVGPAPLYADEARSLTVVNRSDVPASVSLTVDGLGWSLEPLAFTLDAGARRAVEVVEVGPDVGSVVVTVESVEPPPPGEQRGAVALSTQLYPARPFDPTPWIVGGFLLAFLAVALVVIAARRLRHWNRK